MSLPLTKGDLRLVGVSEAAKLFGVSRQRVNVLQRTDAGFPLPVAVLDCGRIWLAEDIEAYAATRNTQRGKLRK